MRFFIDVAHKSLNKYNEELCGDKVEIIKDDNSTIIVLADGLGSGVKANILATITAKIAATLLKEGTDIYETVDTIMNTLPICKVRKFAYCTFTIIKVQENGQVYIAEYDNPPVFYINNRSETIDKKKILINDKTVYESNFTLKEEDVLTIVSDGAIHAGRGNILNYGWQWENVLDYLDRRCAHLSSAKLICNDLLETCNDLYGGNPGDDTTVAVIKAKKYQPVSVLIGPPADASRDSLVVSDFMQSTASKIICGGSTANMVARELNVPLEVDFTSIDNEIPPIGVIKGIDLITEGILTLRKTLEMINDYTNLAYFNVSGEDGASKLFTILVEKSTHIDFLIGKAINPAHERLDFPIHLNKKLELIDELAKALKNIGKEVSLKII